MAKRHDLIDYERAAYELPQQTILTKAAGLWLAIYDQTTCVWQRPKETFADFLNRANNELRKIHTAKV